MHTCEDKGALLSEEAAVIVPFRGVPVDWPAFADFGHAVTVEDVFNRAVDVNVGIRLGLFLSDVIHGAVRLVDQFSTGVLIPFYLQMLVQLMELDHDAPECDKNCKLGTWHPPDSRLANRHLE